jgi:hypothetical protein
VKTLDHIALAVRRGRTEGEAGIRAYFQENMNATAQLRFDHFLVEMSDDLAWMAGPCERRFLTRCERMLRNLEGGAE